MLRYCQAHGLQLSNARFCRHCGQETRSVVGRLFWTRERPGVLAWIVLVVGGAWAIWYVVSGINTQIKQHGAEREAQEQAQSRYLQTMIESLPIEWQSVHNALRRVRLTEDRCDMLVQFSEKQNLPPLNPEQVALFMEFFPSEPQYTRGETRKRAFETLFRFIGPSIPPSARPAP
jgi:hypothetical protein